MMLLCVVVVVGFVIYSNWEAIVFFARNDLSRPKVLWPIIGATVASIFCALLMRADQRR